MIDPSALAAIPLLARAAPAARQIMAMRGVTRRYDAGQVLFTAGTPSQGLFIILEGQVRVTTFRWSRAHAVHVETPGGTLGEVPLFDGEAYPATAVAAEPTVCAALSREVLLAMLQADPAWALALLERLAQRIRHLVERLDRNTAQSVPARLAAVLLECQAVVPGAAFGLGRSQQELAEDLGTVREVVVRNLARFRREGRLKSEGRGRYRVVDAEALARVAADAGE